MGTSRNPSGHAWWAERFARALVKTPLRAHVAWVNRAAPWKVARAKSTCPSKTASSKDTSTPKVTNRSIAMSENRVRRNPTSPSNVACSKDAPCWKVVRPNEALAPNRTPSNRAERWNTTPRNIAGPSKSRSGSTRTGEVHRAPERHRLERRLGAELGADKGHLGSGEGRTAQPRRLYEHGFGEPGVGLEGGVTQVERSEPAAAGVEVEERGVPEIDGQIRPVPVTGTGPQVPGENPLGGLPDLEVRALGFGLRHPQVRTDHVHDGLAMRGLPLGQALQGVQAAEPHRRPVAAQQLDRLCVQVGDAPLCGVVLLMPLVGRSDLLLVRLHPVLMLPVLRRHLLPVALGALAEPLPPGGDQQRHPGPGAGHHGEPGADRVDAQLRPGRTPVGLAEQPDSDQPAEADGGEQAEAREPPRHDP